MSETERQAIYRQRLIEGLCKLEDPSGGIQFYKDDPELYIRLFRDQTNDPSKISFGIPHSYKMITHYAPIQDWFCQQGIEWRDSLRDGQKYMYAELDRDPIALERTISSAGQVLFNSNEMSTHIDVSIADISLAAIYRSVTAFNICLIIIAFSAFVFPLYQLLHIFSLAKPSLANLDWIELALLFGFYGVGLNLHFLRRKPHLEGKKSWNPLRLNKFPVVALAIFILAALSTV